MHDRYSKIFIDDGFIVFCFLCNISRSPLGICLLKTVVFHRVSIGQFLFNSSVFDVAQLYQNQKLFCVSKFTNNMDSFLSPLSNRNPIYNILVIEGIFYQWSMLSLLWYHCSMWFYSLTDMVGRCKITCNFWYWICVHHKFIYPCIFHVKHSILCHIPRLVSFITLSNERSEFTIAVCRDWVNRGCNIRYRTSEASYIKP